VRRQELPYYVCGGYIASGVTVCDGLRVPMAYLDEAVLQGIRNASNRLLTWSTQTLGSRQSAAERWTRSGIASYIGLPMPAPRFLP